MSERKQGSYLEPGLRKSLQAVKKRNQERIAAEGISRREGNASLLKAGLIMGAITGAIFFAVKEADDAPTDILNQPIDIVRSLDGPTSEQNKAEFLFRTAPESAFVHDLTAIGDVDDKSGERIKVNLRNRPATEWSFPAEAFNIDGGKIEGQLGLDQKISKALLVWGENPNVGDGHDRSVWIAVKDTKGDIYFAAAKAGFTGLADEVDAPVYDLREVELP